MNRKGFRLPQAAPRLLTKPGLSARLVAFVMVASTAFILVPPGIAWAASAAKPVSSPASETLQPGLPTQTPGAGSETDEASDDGEHTDERNVVHSLRDYERTHTRDKATTTDSTESNTASQDDYINDYIDEETGADGVLRSLEGPDVVITAGANRTVYEYRQNGQLRLVKVIPRIGRPYYLVPADPTRGFGDLDQANRLLPQWKIIEF